MEHLVLIPQRFISGPMGFFYCELSQNLKLRSADGSRLTNAETRARRDPRKRDECMESCPSTCLGRPLRVRCQSLVLCCFQYLHSADGSRLTNAKTRARRGPRIAKVRSRAKSTSSGTGEAVDIAHLGMSHHKPCRWNTAFETLSRSTVVAIGTEVAGVIVDSRCETMSLDPRDESMESCPSTCLDRRAHVRRLAYRQILARPLRVRCQSLVLSCFQLRARNGFQRGANQQDEFLLADTEAKFLDEMLKKCPGNNTAPNQGQGGAAAPGSSSKGEMQIFVLPTP
jgi:hypothetical protein